jgi:hypothetical protein
MTKKSASIVATLLILAGGGAAVYFTSQSHDSAAVPVSGRGGTGSGTPSPTSTSAGDPRGQTSAGGATGGPAASGNGRALPRGKEPTVRESAYIAKYGDSRFAMAKQLTPTMLNLLGKDGIPAVMRTLGIQSKADDLAYFTENYELTDEQKETVSALYDRMQAQKREKFAADIAYLTENPDILTERLLAGDALKRGTISEAEFLDTVGKLDRRVWNLGLLIDSQAGNLDAGELMAEAEFVTGFKKLIGPEGADQIDQMLAENPQIADARKERLAAENELPKAGNAESLEDIDKMMTSLKKMVGTAKILIDGAQPALRKTGEGGGK